MCYIGRMKTMKKFTIDDYITITKECDQVARSFMLLDSVDKQEQADAFAKIITSALPQVVQVISIATGSTKEEIGKMDDIEEIINYLFGIVEINNFLSLKKRLVDRFKALKS